MQKPGHADTYQSGLPPELSCDMSMLCSSPREKGILSMNTSTPPLSNTGFSGSDKLKGSLCPSVNWRVTITWEKKTLELRTFLTYQWVSLKSWKFLKFRKWGQAHKHRVYHLRSGASPSSVACLHIHKVIVQGTWMTVLQQSHLTLWTQIFYHITGICIKDLGGYNKISLALKFCYVPMCFDKIILWWK